MKRYWIISYNYELENGNNGVGFTTYQTPLFKFINLKDFTEWLKVNSLNSLKSVAILNIIRISKKEHLEFVRK